MNKKIVSSVLYVFSLLFFAFGVWSLVESHNYLQAMAAAGQVELGFSYQVINFYVSSCVQYFVYALILAALAYIVQHQETEVNCVVESTCCESENTPKMSVDLLKEQAEVVEDLTQEVVEETTQA